MWVLGKYCEEICRNIKTNVELIQSLLAATGCGLDLQKCAWTIINASTTIPNEIKITRTPYDARLREEAIYNIHKDTTFTNLHYVSRLSGISPPQNLNQPDVDQFIAQASTNVKLKYIPPTTTQK